MQFLQHNLLLSFGGLQQYFKSQVIPLFLCYVCLALVFSIQQIAQDWVHANYSALHALIYVDAHSMISAIESWWISYYLNNLIFQLMCFVNMALVVSTSPVPQQRPPHHQQRRPSGPFSFLENFFNSTMRFFSNSTFGSSSTNNRQSALRQLYLWSFWLKNCPKQQKSAATCSQ